MALFKTSSNITCIDLRHYEDSFEALSMDTAWFGIVQQLVSLKGKVVRVLSRRVASKIVSLTHI